LLTSFFYASIANSTDLAYVRLTGFKTKRKAKDMQPTELGCCVTGAMLARTDEVWGDLLGFAKLVEI